MIDRNLLLNVTDQDSLVKLLKRPEDLPPAVGQGEHRVV